MGVSCTALLEAKSRQPPATAPVYLPSTRMWGARTVARIDTQARNSCRSISQLSLDWRDRGQLSILRIWYAI